MGLILFCFQSFSVNKKELNTIEKKTNIEPSCKIYLRSDNRCISYSIGREGLYLQNLGMYGFNDKMTDFMAESNVLNSFRITLFRDSNYGGRYIDFLISNDMRIYLNAYVMSNKAVSWAYQVTSVKVEYIGN